MDPYLSRRSWLFSMVGSLFGLSRSGAAAAPPEPAAFRLEPAQIAAPPGGLDVYTYDGLGRLTSRTYGLTTSTVYE